MAQNGGGGPPPPPRHHHRHQPERYTFGQEAGTGTTVISSTVAVNAPPPPLLSPFFTTPMAAAAVAVAASATSQSHQRQDMHTRDIISLSQPRPGIARVRNEYIDTPLRPPPPQQQHHQQISPPQQQQPSSSSSNACSFFLMSKGTPTMKSTSMVSGRFSNPADVHRHNSISIRELIQLPQSRTSTNFVGLVPSSTPVTVRQPRSIVVDRKSDSLKGGTDVRTLLPLTRTRTTTTTTTTSNSMSTITSSSDSQQQHGDSIICRDCKRCKCAACGSPRPLPATWICQDKYQCSAETLVDQCSCMCCVKGVFYHTTKDFEMDDDVSCADRPCSCDPHRRCSRWACVGLLTALLPCLLCYWPLRGCLRLCELCYTKYNNRHACQCATRKSGGTSANIFLSSSSSMDTDESRRKTSNAITVPPSSKRLLQQHDHHQHHQVVNSCD